MAKCERVSISVKPLFLLFLIYHTDSPVVSCSSGSASSIGSCASFLRGCMTFGFPWCRVAVLSLLPIVMFLNVDAIEPFLVF